MFIAELCQIKHHYLLSQNNLLRVSKNIKEITQRQQQYQIEDRDSASTTATTSTTGTASNIDAYLVIDFNVCIVELSEPLNPSEIADESMPNTVRPQMSTKEVSLTEKSCNFLSYLMKDTSSWNMLQLEIPSTVPISPIIGEHSDDLFGQINGLYTKYVAFGSNYEINIPYQLREDVATFIENYVDQKTNNNPNNAPNISSNDNIEMIEGDLFWLMDECCLTLIHLLLTPLRRFKFGTKYQEYINSMEHQAKSANYEFTHIHKQSTINKKPKIYNGQSYDQLAQLYKNK